MLSPRTDERLPSGPETPAPTETPYVPPLPPPPEPPPAPIPTPSATPTPSSTVLAAAIEEYRASIAVQPPVTQDASRTPPPVQPLAKVDQPPAGESTVIIGGLVSNCATQQVANAVTTACGTQTTPPATGLKPDTPRKTTCNALPKVMRARATLPGPGGPVPPGLYVHVVDGLVLLSNRGGAQGFTAGQFGFAGGIVQPPVVVPRNPAIQFAPPPSFAQQAGGLAGSGSRPNAASVACEVRSLARSAGRLEVARGESIARGSIVFITTGGLAPNSAVSVYLLSSPKAALADFNADDQGNLAGWVRMPGTAETGANVLQVNGYTPEGYSASINIGISVRTAMTTTANEQVYFDYRSTGLTKSARASLDATLAKIPLGMANSCTVTPVTSNGTRTAYLVDLARARAAATARYLIAKGLACEVVRTPAATAGVTYRARRANLAIAYDH